MVWSTIIHKDNPKTFQNNPCVMVVVIWKTTPYWPVGLLLLVVFPISCWLLCLGCFVFYLRIFLLFGAIVSMRVGCYRVYRFTFLLLVVFLVWQVVVCWFYFCTSMLTRRYIRFVVSFKKNYQKSEAVILNLQHPCLVYLHIHLPELLTTSSTIW